MDDIFEKGISRNERKERENRFLKTIIRRYKKAVLRNKKERSKTKLKRRCGCKWEIIKQ